MGNHACLIQKTGRAKCKRLCLHWRSCATFNFARRVFVPAHQPQPDHAASGEGAG